jgi:hypothetical protein
MKHDNANLKDIIADWQIGRLAGAYTMGLLILFNHAENVTPTSIKNFRPAIDWF